MLPFANQANDLNNRSSSPSTLGTSSLAQPDQLPLVSTTVHARPYHPPSTSPHNQPVINPATDYLPVPGVASHNLVLSPPPSNALQGKPNPLPVPPRPRTSQKPNPPPVPPRLRTDQLTTNPFTDYLPVLGVASHNSVSSLPTSNALQGKPNPPPVPPRPRASQQLNGPPVPPRPRTFPRNQLISNQTTSPAADVLPVSGVTPHNALSSFPMSDTLQGRSDCPSGSSTPLCDQPNRPPAQGILEGAKDFKIENSVLTNVQGDALMFRFEFDGPPTEEFKNLFTHHMEGLVTIKDFDRIANTIKEHALSQAIRDLPRAKAAYNDYTPSKRRRSACFKNTRQALLKEIALCVTSTSGPRAYLLFGIAGIGKSTVAQTIAEKADTLRLLGASFFFSRDEADRRTAEKFFTSIAFQLCAYDKQFSEAIGAVLTKERGATATSKDPQEQLTVLILEPLRGIDRSRSLPTVIVVDALDECDVGDAPIILMALNRLVQELPSFRVVLTSRPQRPLQHLLDRLGAHKALRMEDIEQKVIEGDTRLYLKHSLTLGQVYARLHLEWAASDEDIEVLVRAAGRLFIIASTAVLFILDADAYNPGSRMKKLRDEFSQNRTPFNALNDFYTIMLRTAIPLNCERDIVERYQSVVGTIVLIEDPLPVGALAGLIGMSTDDVRSALGNLQSVIALDGNDVPLVYHKSFPDYITNGQRCQDIDLRIAPKGHHTRLATRCLRIMNGHLKRNILGLGPISQYLDNQKALEEEQQSWDSVQRAIPSELQYASVHWAKHVVQADLEDTDLMTELKTFTEEHLLHWLEALSWIRKLDTAHIPLGEGRRLQTLSSDIRLMLSDALRFVSRDYEKIERAALGVYHSALPFAPTETLLYKKYKHEIRLCQVEGGLAQWDTLIAEKKHGDNIVRHLTFAKDNSRFASWNEDNVKLWDAASGTFIRIFDGDGIALADDFSVLVVPQDSLVTIYSVSSSAPIASFDHSSTVIKMAISFGGSQLAAGLESGTVRVWDLEKGISIASLDDYNNGPLTFSLHGNILAFASTGGISLWNGVDIFATLEELEKPVRISVSNDGTRLAILVAWDVYSLSLWNGANGVLIASVRDVGENLAVSDNGSFIATGGKEEVWVWSGDSLVLVHKIPSRWTQDLAFLGDTLAIASSSPGGAVTLYDVQSKTSIATLPIDHPTCLAFSPDGTRLAAGNWSGAVHLWDIPSIRASVATPKQQVDGVSALALSQDCLRLASGRRDGSVELWDTSNMKREIACHNHHSEWVTALAFSPDGKQLASGSHDKRVRFWDGWDGSPTGILEHTFPDRLPSLAFSSSILAAGTPTTITLWDRTSLCLIHTFEQGGYSLSFSLDGRVLVSICSPDSEDSDPSDPDSNESDSDDSDLSITVCESDFNTDLSITVWDTENLMVAAIFTVSGNNITVFPSPEGSRLAAQDQNSGLIFFDVINKRRISHPANNLSWVPHLNGIPMSWNWNDDNGDRLVGWVSPRHDCVPMLWVPRSFHMCEFASQSSTFALGCGDGRILLIRPPASH